MRLGTAIELLIDNYRYAKGKAWIRDEVAWALYQTWKEADRKTENSSEKPNNSKDEPQTNADQHVQRVEYVGNDEKSRCWTCKHFESMHETPISSDGKYYTYVVCTAKECNYESKGEPQTNKEIVLDPSFAELSDEQFVEAMKLIEPQTEMPRCSVNGTPFDECGFCEYFNCDLANVKQMCHRRKGVSR